MIEIKRSMYSTYKVLVNAKKTAKILLMTMNASIFIQNSGNSRTINENYLFLI